MEQAGRGDREAFRELFDRYHGRVYRYAYGRIGGGPEEAQDVTQEVFVAAWQGLPRFRYEHDGSFPAWLFGIARNVVATHQRRSSRNRNVSMELLPEVGVEFEGSVISRELLVGAMLCLPESQREILLLRFWTGLSLKEVAKVLGKSESAVSTTQLRALRRLRKRLEEGS